MLEHPSAENNIDKAHRRVDLLLQSVKANTIIVWEKLTPRMQDAFKVFDAQDWRDFAQTVLEKTYEEYTALDGYYLPPDEVHILQDGLDKFAEVFPLWFKENFNSDTKTQDEKNGDIEEN